MISRRHWLRGLAGLAVALQLHGCGGADPQADVVVSGSGPAQAMAPGSVVEFRMRVANAGPDDADTIVLANTLDPQLTLLSVGCEAEGGARCPAAPSIGMSIDGLPAGGALVFVVRAQLPAVVDGAQVSNTMATRRVPGDPDLSNNEARAVAAVANARLTVAYASDGFAAVGQDLAFRATVANLGPGAATDVTLTRADPAGLTPLPLQCQAFDGAICPVDLAAAELKVPLLPAGGRLEIRVPYGSAGALPGDVSGSLTARTGSDPFPADNVASATLRLVSPSAVLVTSHRAAATAVAGDAVTFRAEVRNRDLRSVFTPVFSFVLPAGSTATGWTCTASGGAACPAVLGPSMSLAALPGGGGLVFDYRIDTAPEQSGTELVSRFEATADGIPPGADNRALAVTTLRAPQADLQLRQTLPATMMAGTPERITVTLDNLGPDTARGIELSQIVDGAVASGSVVFTCTAVGGARCPAVVGGTQTLADMPSGASLRLVADLVTSTGGGTVHARATVRSDADPVATNDAVDGAVSLQLPPAGLSARLGAPAVVAAGNDAVFTALVVNGGPRAAERLVLDLSVDGIAGDLVVACRPSDGARCPDALGQTMTLDSLPAGAWLQLFLTARISTTAVPGSVVRGRIAASADGDPATGDNLAAAQTTVVSAAADLQLNASTADVVPAGDAAEVVVVLINRGPSTAVDAVLTLTNDPAVAPAVLGCEAAGGAHCPADGSDARQLRIDSLPAGSALRLRYALPTVGLAIGTPLTIDASVRYAGDPDATNDSTRLQATIGAAADARNGRYQMLVADGRQQVLELDFNRAELRIDGVISAFSGPQADGSYVDSSGRRFLAARGLVVGLHGEQGARVPFVAARDFVTDLAELGDGSDLALLGRGTDAGVSGSRYSGARLGRDQLEICNFSTPLTIAACPAAAVRRFRLSIAGDRIDATEDGGSGAGLSFRVARAGGELVLLRAARSADGADTVWQVGLVARSPSNQQSIGPSTAGDWRRYELGTSPARLVVAGDATDSVTLDADSTGWPTGLQGGLRSSDAAAVFVFGSSQLTVTVVARGAPATGFVSIGLTP